uniref:hypothetical protein n=1 Tax=Staphylococcus aureus TaxID=1280 RepID=UPI0020401EA6
HRVVIVATPHILVTGWLFLCYIINDQTTPPINLGVWLFSRAKKGHNFETKGKGMNNKLS